ncbi:hypothetical protein GS3922_00115 [Geobacillus subterraneus]|uniref:Lipoprotein n=2 Tax=Geobacillus TaxID=129337 RepID=A0ABN4NCS9_9BACL|nr:MULTISPECIES: hypothetical protein [Geobacillus]AMX82232.1 hypothetical protein GS3922_00115 [Geobacillus subterraneus]KZS25514.1 hypothetical protein A5418_00415 [Geobacillus subterraneus]OXB87476.1 hypothetical protein B9L21_12665 [Geobacillus uzenensis]
MRAAIYYSLFLILMLVLTGCGNKEETTKTNVTQATEEKSESGKNEENEDSSQEKPEEKEEGFKILETVQLFGGGTFNIDNQIEDVRDYYISEKEDTVFLSFEDVNHSHVVNGTKDGWKSISVEIEDTHRRKLRGASIFNLNEDDAFEYGEWNKTDLKFYEMYDKVVPADSRIYDFATTSEGEAIIVNTGEQEYSIYTEQYLRGFGGNDSEESVLKFTDVKDFYEADDGFEYEQSIYVDMEKKRLFFVYGSSIYVMDLSTGKPLFEDGKPKNITTDGYQVKIIGDGSGNLYVVGYGDSVNISVYNSDLDLVMGPFEVPVTDPEDVAVTVTDDEIHIWDVHTYELEPALELVRLSKPSLQ